MSDLFEVPENSLQLHAAAAEQSRIQESIDRARQLIGRCALVLGIAAGGGVAAVASEAILENPMPAYAATFANDYPDGDATDCSATYGIYSWCKGNPSSWLSPRSYGYRNCTDGVAYWVKKYTDVTLPSNLGNANTWDTQAPSTYTVYAGNTNSIEPGDIAQSDDGSFGHVGFVTDVTKNSDGTVASFVTAEMNAAGTGLYSSQSYTTKNSLGKFSRGSTNDWDHFIDVNGAGKGLNNEDLSGSGSGSSGLARPAAISFNNALNVFIRGGDGNIYAQYWNGNSWSGYTSIGGGMASDPSLIVNNGALSVFARGDDNQIYTKGNNGSGWNGWVSLGATQMKGTPRVIQYGSEVDVFALGQDGHPYKNTWQPTSGWGGWSSLGNYMDSSPAPVVNGSNLSVVMRGGDNAVYVDTWNGAGWSGFGSLGGVTSGNPDALAYGSQTEVVVNTPNVNHVYMDTWNGTNWGGWADHGGVFNGDVEAMQYNQDLEFFVRGTDGHLYTRWWSASSQTWGGWNSLGGAIAGDPTAIQYSTELDVFAVGTDGKTYKDTFNPNTGWGGFTALPG